ncbi:FkbH domain containing protein [Parasponia andersonii]|uniref:FkbH domain containing protein n=1 Tax=Parasponia andersonii TaxID=3476 RepID=A0A2P5DKV4_PARAD|nr:FkbH domain containing protein [Parasponia andersonii]
MEINPSKIILRPFNLMDVDDLMLFAGDDKVTRQLRWNTLTSKDEALTFIKEVCIPHPWRRSICIDDRSIGFISVFPGSGEYMYKANIGYGVAPKYWGQGVATQALKIAVPQVFKDLPELVRVEAFVHIENKASQRVLEKIGFQKEGLLRKYTFLKGRLIDFFVYSFLSTDFPPQGSN